MKKKGNNIGWCDKTANPVTGCPNGCEYCYARGMNERFGWVEDFSKPQFFPNRLKEFRTKESMIIFIDSMSDIGCWRKEWLDETLLAMEQNQQNIYLALTKVYAAIKHIKGKQLYNFVKATSAPRFEYNYNLNLFIGATVTNNAQAQAVIDAGGADFISFEPLMEMIEPELLAGLRCKWWIVGDMTKGGKPQGVTQKEWVDEINMDSYGYCIPLFMKDSIHKVMGRSFVKEFPSGWKK